MNKIQKEVKEYQEERNWHLLRPGDLAKSVSIEAAELLEIFQWDNPELKEILENKEKVEKISKEVADVFIYCYSLCAELNLDAEEVIRKKLEHVREKYPAKLMKERKPGNDLYWKIKHEHRKRGE